MHGLAVRLRKYLILLFIVTLVLYLLYYYYVTFASLSTNAAAVERRCIPVEEHYEIIRNISSSVSKSQQPLENARHHHLKNKTAPKIERRPPPPPPPPISCPLSPPIGFGTEVKHLVFGIAASAELWETRKEYVKVWWRPRSSRAVVWMDQPVPRPKNREKKDEALPDIKISGDTSEFKYSNRQGHRSALRISRVVSETLKLGLKDVRWFVMGDDDTVFIPENVARILDKYDHRQPYYIGSSSESHLQNIYFSYNMAYGGGGFAISYPLARELAQIQDKCIQRYPGLYGSDDRVHACMAELGVPLTKEPGFHQYDVSGDLLGLLAAHPVTPLASLHHLDIVEPIFPGKSRVEALHQLFQSVRVDAASVIQQSICYDRDRYWSVSVSWGYAVQVWRGVISPRELEVPTRTFENWYKRADYTAYSMNTRPVTKHPCLKPFIFYMSATKLDRARKKSVGVYYRHKTPSPYCRWKMASPQKINSIVVVKRPDYQRWKKSPRRDCCRVLPSNRTDSMYVWVGSCRTGEISELDKK
ncbi:unnamed protein product [Linum tenue]|uniref:Uncharacterized protein n=1 Tax=Linum tenue TaxID=586396 RepID=A0AAV0QLQ0_9ROSI|nr:unnamed protein product [Linum tenue]